MLFSHRAFTVRAAVPSLVTGVLWCAAALGVGYWVLQVPSSWAPSEKVISMNGAADSPSVETNTRLSRALGATSVTASDAPDEGRLQLVGVIAGTSGQGSALIAVDGQAPKAYRVGQSVAEGLVLQRLSTKGAQLGATLDGPRLKNLEMPADKAP